METISKVKDVIHHVNVWYVSNTLPDAKKPYIARPEPLPYLGVGEVAAKASLYGENIDPEEMIRYVERYFTVGAYLVADGYGIENAFFRTRIRVPGEYDGGETSLPEGEYPEARINASAAFRTYIRNHVQFSFKGIDETRGHMFRFLDDATGQDSVMTAGNLLRIYGTGLKIAHDDKPEHAAEAGLWFVNANNPDVRMRATAVAVNEPRTVVGLVPVNLSDGPYYVEIVTQTSVKHSGTLLKELRTVRSEHTLEYLVPQ
ncbi:MAG: DUF4469 domain-containing protein [Tannerella sp.]|jgi:hypothetical protein|nr:DUF4469 domain-containing protein [Tannerella sp.]